MKVKQLARTIARTTALVLGLLALRSLAGALCLGSLMLVARCAPNAPPVECKTYVEETSHTWQ